jgi:hypothetical protein
MTEEEFQRAVLAQLNKLETGIQSVHARLEVWIRTFNARMDSLDHRLNVIDSGLDAVEKRLTILETTHHHHMADIT